jgi:hypothetical protein
VLGHRVPIYAGVVSLLPIHNQPLQLTSLLRPDSDFNAITTILIAESCLYTSNQFSSSSRKAPTSACSRCLVSM